MSTDKTSLPYIPLIVGLLVIFIACAPVRPTKDLAETVENSQEATAENSADNVNPVIDDETSIAEPEQTAFEEIKELAGLDNWEEGAAADEKEISYDFPVTVNRQVEFYLNFFQTKQRISFSRWLIQSGRYLPLMQQKLKEAGLPQDLAYLPMIESGYNLSAYSSAGAAGPWQFMRATGRHYGLTINRYVDERRDPVKSTDAAIKYLGKLYDDFGSWQLAVAAYNAGEGRIRRAIRRKGTDNFWKIAQGRTLSIETKRYVPKLIAAIMIAKNPAQYGFDNINYEPPIAFDEITVPPWTTMAAVAVAGDLDTAELRDLNRQLRSTTTPPGPNDYTLKVPSGKGTLVAENLPRVQASITTRYRTHIVKRADSLTKIGRMYNLNKKTLLKANNLRGPNLKIGQRLQIPYQTTAYTLLPKGQKANDKILTQGKTKNMVLHTVQSGETLSHIAKLYNVPGHLIASWNGLKSINSIRTGQQLALYLDETSRILTAQSKINKSIKTAQNIASDSSENARQLTYYMVRGGDSLWTISRKFNLSMDEIRRWNNLKDDTIQPGSRLLIKESDLGV